MVLKYQLRILLTRGSNPSELAGEEDMSEKTAYVLMLILLIIGIGIGWAAGGGGGVQTVTKTVTAGAPGAKTVTVTQTVTGAAAAGLKGEIPIGALLPLTGALSSYGENSKAALELAEKEINDWLAARGEPWKIKVYYEDTATDPKTALDKVQALHSRGVKIFIGPQSSAEVKELKNYVDSNKLLLISQSSTSPRLAIPGDMVYRYCPTDEIQGPASATALYDLGIRYVVQVWRGDEWGDALAEKIDEEFEKILKAHGEAGEVLGKKNGKGIRYDPEATEFSAVVAQLDSLVSELINKYGADKVGVSYIGFNEYVQFAAVASQYESLRKVKWVGSDGTALLSEITTNADAAKFAFDTKFVSPIFGAATPIKEKVKNYVVKTLGREPDSYAYAAYDALWTVAVALDLVDSYDPVAVAKTLPTIGKNWFGASGIIELNENGDRASADYFFYMPNQKDGAWTWELAGVYSATSGTITWEDWFLSLLGRS